MGLAIHNYGIQEYMQHSEATNTVFEQSMTFVDGYLHPGDKPGIGVEFNEEAAAAYPYQQAYLPYNRLVDGFRAATPPVVEVYDERAGEIAEHGYSAPRPAPVSS